MLRAYWNLLAGPECGRKPVGLRRGARRLSSSVWSCRQPRDVAQACCLQLGMTWREMGLVLFWRERRSHGAGSVLRWPNDDLCPHSIKLVEAPASHVLILGHENTTFGPLTVWAEFNVSHYGFEHRVAHVVRQRVVLDAASVPDRLFKDLHSGEHAWRNIMTQLIDVGLSGASAVSGHKFRDPRQIQRWRANEQLVTDYTGQALAEMLLKRRVLQADHSAAKQSCTQPGLERCPEDSRTVGRVARHKHEVGVCGLDSSNDCTKFNHVRWIRAIVDDPKTKSLGNGSGALECVNRELRISSHKSGALRLGIQCHGGSEKPGPELLLSVRPIGHCLKIARVLESGVHRQRERRQDQLVPLNHS